MTGCPQAIGYVRVSTDRQADSGLGLEAQREVIGKAAERLGLPVTAVFEDAGLSGDLGIDERKGLFDAVTELRSGDVLIVAKRDRIARNVIVSALVERMVTQRGARLLSAAGEGTDGDDPDDPSSVLQRRILDAFGEYERLVIRQRTKAALRAKKARGERTGTVRFGYRVGEDGKRLVPDDGEQRVLQFIRERRGAGLSLRAVAEELERSGYRTRSGSPWRHQYVASLEGR
jgi:DNA invertase Pin-like site-specific DNA recombinase